MSSCENCTTIDDYNEKCRLSNPCKSHRGYAVQIKDFNSCLEDICDSSNFTIEVSYAPIVTMIKCHQMQNTYPGGIANKT